MSKKKFPLIILSLMVLVSVCYSARHKIMAVVASIIPQMQIEELKEKPQTQEQVIKAIVKSHLPEIMNCYNDRLKSGLDKNGQLKVSWELDEKGQSSNFQELTNELEDQELFSCSTQAISKWIFPKGIPFKVSYTFHLKQKEKRETATERPAIVEE